MRWKVMLVVVMSLAVSEICGGAGGCFCCFVLHFDCVRLLWGLLRGCWVAARRLLGGGWEAARRLLEDCWEAGRLLLGGC